VELCIVIFFVFFCYGGLLKMTHLNLTLDGQAAKTRANKAAMGTIESSGTWRDLAEEKKGLVIH
jgi:hypothetical protein